MASSPEEKQRHRKRMMRKKKEAKKKFKVKSPIAKSLEDPLFHQRIVLDKKGKTHDLEKMTFRDLVEAIDED